MKRLLYFLIFTSGTCFAQNWQAEILAGMAGYSGDLSGADVSFRNFRPGVNLNIKYKLNPYFLVRAGIGWGKVGADDNNSSDSILRSRNLSFQSDILEANIGIEVNLLSPELFDSYPYVFAGVGVFHFDPYSFDNNHNKIYLQPLSTEGEGFAEYPNRQQYALTQFCIPFGGGIKKKLSYRCEGAFELGFRKLFTDYLDDVSTTYANPTLLLAYKGPKAVEMAYRGPTTPPVGKARGNSGKDDWYYFTGIKLTYTLGAKKKSAAAAPAQPNIRRRN